MIKSLPVNEEQAIRADIASVFLVSGIVLGFVSWLLRKLQNNSSSSERERNPEAIILRGINFDSFQRTDSFQWFCQADRFLHDATSEDGHR